MYPVYRKKPKLKPKLFTTKITTTKFFSKTVMRRHKPNPNYIVTSK